MEQQPDTGATRESPQPTTDNEVAFDSRVPDRDLSGQASPDATAHAAHETDGQAGEPAVPPAIAARFLRVENRYYFPDRTLAFTDLGTKLKARTHNTEVIRSLVVIAQARGWSAIRVTGTPEFRSQVWREASLRGLEVRGHDPSDVEREALRQAIARRERPHAAPGDAPDAPQAPSSTTGPPDAQSPLLRGRLVAHGAAPYKFDPAQSLSYHVRLQTDDGERVLWGVDLERAIVESRTGVRTGDEVAVENRGSEPVSVKIPKRDASGRVVGQRILTTHRNAWVIERASYFEERTTRATTFRAGDIAKDDLARDPELARAVASLRLGERFAAERIEHAQDRERFVALLRERLAQALEQGDPVPTLAAPNAPGREAGPGEVAVAPRARARTSTAPTRGDMEPPHARA